MSSPAPPSRDGKPETTPIESRVLAAAHALLHEGKAISIKAACERAGVNRSHFVKRYPAMVKMVKFMAGPDRRPRRGSKTDGDVEAWSDDD